MARCLNEVLDDAVFAVVIPSVQMVINISFLDVLLCPLHQYQAVAL